MKIIKIISVLVICIFSSIFSFAQKKTHVLDPAKAISQYTLKTWSIEDGMPSLSLTDIVQLGKRHIWIGTYNGLVRFDGIQFETFNTNNTAQLQSSSITSLVTDKDKLWIGTHKGIVCYENNEFSQKPALNKLDDYSIEKLFIDSENRLWIGTTAHGLYVLEQDGELKKVSHPRINNSPIKAIAESKEKEIWIGTDLGDVYKTDDALLAKLVYPSSFTSGISTIYLAKDGVLWIGTNNGLLRVENGNTKEYEEISFNDAGDILEDAFGNMWLTNNNGIYRVNKTSGKIENYSEAQGLPNNLIRKLLFDHQGNLWIASYRAGLFQLTDGIFTCYSPSEGLRENVVTSMIQQSNSTYWVAMEGGLIDVLKNGKVMPLELSSPLPSNRVKHLMKDKDGFVWVSTYGGVVKIDSNGVVQPLPKALKNIDSYTRQTYQDKKGNIWISTRRGGLYKLGWEGTLSTFDTQDGLGSNYVMSIDEGNDGKMLIGTKNGVSIIENDKVIQNISTKQGLPSTLVFDVLPKGEAVWICTDLGLCKYEGDSMLVFNTADGLPEDVYFDIVEDKLGNFWISTNGGIVQVSEKQLKDYAQGKSKFISSRIYGKSDGMKSEQCVGATKMFFDNQDALWVPTVEGVASIMTSELQSTYEIPKPYIEKVVTDQRTYYPKNGIIEFQSEEAKRISIYFTAFDFVAPSKSKFKYQLAPFDEKWRVAEKNIREVNYTNLPPKKYTFRVQTGNNNDVWNEEKGELTLKITPHFYQTIWFYIACISIFIASTYLFYLSKLRFSKRRERLLQEKVDERTNALLMQKQQLEETFEELKATQSQVVQSEKMASLGQLTAGIAHEINNPVNFIFAGVDALKILMNDLSELLDKYEELDKNSAEAPKIFEEIKSLKKEIEYQELRTDITGLIDDITNGAERTTEIVMSLRVFARDDSTEFKPVDIHELINSCLIILRSAYKGEVEIVKEYNSLPLVACSAGKIGQVLSNIINNAIQSIEEKGKVTITTQKATKLDPNVDAEKELEFVEIIIEDTGSGISEEVMSKIFDPFFTTKDVGKGTGLGLSISQDIIQQHKGNISVESTIGQGTTFTIALPVGVE